jgi:hypothetical protein
MWGLEYKFLGRLKLQELINMLLLYNLAKAVTSHMRILSGLTRPWVLLSL